VVHGLHHALQHRIEDSARLLRVAIGEQFHRAFEVGEQHRDLLALAFQRRARGQDALGEVLGRVVLGNGGCGRGYAAEDPATLAAEVLVGWGLAPARGAQRNQPCPALAAEFLDGRVVVLTGGTLHGAGASAEGVVSANPTRFAAGQQHGSHDGRVVRRAYFDAVSA